MADQATGYNRMRAWLADRSKARLVMAASAAVAAGAALWSYSAGLSQSQRDKDSVSGEIALRDATMQVCPPEKPASGGAGNNPAARLLAPLMAVSDRDTGMDGVALLRSAFDKGVRFAVCPVQDGDTQYAVPELPDGTTLMVLKINAVSARAGQQAAILQFLKEFNGAGVGLSHNATVCADPRLAKALAGMENGLRAAIPARLSGAAEDNLPRPCQFPER